MYTLIYLCFTSIPLSVPLLGNFINVHSPYSASHNCGKGHFFLIFFKFSGKTVPDISCESYAKQMRT